MRRFGGDKGILGRQILINGLVAVVKDIPATHPQTRQEPAIFAPFVQEGMHMAGPYTSLQLELAFLMRTQGGNPMSALPAVRPHSGGDRP